MRDESADTRAVYTGSCLCGAVAFEVKGTFDAFFFCHCVRCRKGTGSAHGANLFAPAGQLVWMSGGERVQTFVVPGSRHQRSFCEVCGSAMPGTHGAVVVVPAGCLDTPVDVRPTGHIFHARRAAWEDDLLDAVRFPRLPDDAGEGP